MADDVKLRLELLDVYGKRLGEKVDIDLRHQTLAEHKVVRGVDASKKIAVSGLKGAPQGLYRMEVDPPAYLPVGQFVSMKASGFTDVTVTLPIDPKKVVSVNFPKYKDLDFQPMLEASDKVLSFVGMKGRDLYGELDETRKAGLLNITAKCRATPLANGKTVLKYIEVLHELRGDRFFATVAKELREEVKHSVADGLFHKADQSLHHPPKGFEGFTDAGSFKTGESAGNLQLSFFMKGDACLADIDIDDAAGLGHVFQVLRNTLTGRPTHPFDIHEILILHQKLDPGYTFNV
ncbi:MAG TPA: hypothetical protein VFB63_08355 [Bryobacteraceae bacterium]|jgi:hypothetical protein|nr:hypothetical protein [Bryobacteraceae bacterium]